MRIEVMHPYILLSVPVIIAFLIITAKLFLRCDRKKRIRAVIVRSIIFSLLALSMAGTGILLKGQKTATIFLVDGSDSLKNRESDIIAFINDSIANKTDSDYVGIVSFGKTAVIENFLTDNISYKGSMSDIDASASNLEEAVKLGLSMIPEGYAGRLVLISDGAENAGNLKDTAASVALSKASLLSYSLESAETPEVYVSNLKVPETSGTGESFAVTVEIESNTTSPATVSLYLGRTLKGRRSVILQKGTNTFVFADTQEESGLKTYSVTVEAENDTLSVNNEYYAYTNISTKQPVLIVEGEAGESSYLHTVLNSIGVDTVTVTPENAPGNISSLLEYRGIILVNVFASDLADGFLDNLETYVKDHGRGLITCGGRRSYAMGGYKNTSLETVLPVEMDIKGEKEIPSMAIVLLIDKSGSMSGESLDAAKKAAIAAVDNMREQDSIGVFSFDDSYSEVVRLQTLTDKASVHKAINTIRIEGGTSIYPAVQHAYKVLKDYEASIKHIILLTDGQDGFEKQKYTGLIKDINNDNITFSTVGIGAGCNTDLLNYLAEKCGGRFYLTVNGLDTPKIFTQEVYLTANTYIVDGEFTPIISSNSEIISTVAANGLPSLLGYVATTPKSRATVLLSSPDDDPVLSCWQYGLGHTVAWASDVIGKWSGNFFASPEINQALWTNLISYITEDIKSDGSYAEVVQSGDSTKVIYHTDEFGAGTDVRAVVTDEDGNSSELTLPATAPGVYEASFDMTGTGVYSIAVNQYEEGNITYGITTAAIRHYSTEYTFNDTPGLLEDYTRVTGGKMIEDPKDVFSSDISDVKAMTDLSTALLVAALLLFVLDIAVRRFNISIPVPKFVKPVKNEAKASSGKKEKVAAADDNAVDKPEISSEEPEKTKPKKEKAKKASKEKEEKNEQPEILDTSQLLNRLRK